MAIPNLDLTTILPQQIWSDISSQLIPLKIKDVFTSNSVLQDVLLDNYDRLKNFSIGDKANIIKLNQLDINEISNIFVENYFEGERRPFDAFVFLIIASRDDETWKDRKENIERRLRDGHVPGLNEYIHRHNQLETIVRKDIHHVDFPDTQVPKYRYFASRVVEVLLKILGIDKIGNGDIIELSTQDYHMEYLYFEGKLFPIEERDRAVYERSYYDYHIVPYVFEGPIVSDINDLISVRDIFPPDYFDDTKYKFFDE